jgi:hypothetical protein
MLAMFEKHPDISLAGGVNLGLGAKPGSLTREIAKTLITERLTASPPAAIIPVRDAIGWGRVIAGKADPEYVLQI